MTARRRANDVISPLRAFLFAAALSTALVLVLAPVFPGETHVSAGDPAFKTFRLNGEVVASKGAALDQDTINRIREAGLLDNTTEADAAAAAVMIGVIGASLLALYLYLFQPREVNNLARLVMVGLLEDLQNSNVTKVEDLSSWEPYLGPVARRAWMAVIAFWQGDIGAINRFQVRQ